MDTLLHVAVRGLMIWGGWIAIAHVGHAVSDLLSTVANAIP